MDLNVPELQSFIVIRYPNGEWDWAVSALGTENVCAEDHGADLIQVCDTKDKARTLVFRGNNWD